MMKGPPPVSIELSYLGIPHQVFNHPGPLESLEQAAEERGQLPEQIIRSIVFRIKQDDFVMVLMAGPRQINWRSLRKYLQANRLTMASKEDVFRITGYKLGAVAPFGLPYPMRILVDNSVFKHKIISMGSGVRGTGIILKSDDLIKALGVYEIGNFGGS